MPTPRPSEETRDEFISRCVPIVLEDGTAEDRLQAVAICASMWQQAKEKSMSETLTFKFEVKALGSREFEGHGSTFGNVDLGDDIVMPGAFKKSLAMHQKAGTRPQMFWMHDPSRVPGRWDVVEEDSKGLFVKGTLAPTELGNEMHVLMGMHAVRDLSIGFKTIERDFDKEGHRQLKEIDLWEVSLVSIGMNPRAKIEHPKSRTSRAGEYVPTERELEQCLREGRLPAGCSKNVARLLIARIFDDDPGGMPDGHRWDAGTVDEEAAEVLKGLDNIMATFASGVFQKK